MNQGGSLALIPMWLLCSRIRVPGVALGEPIARATARMPSQGRLIQVGCPLLCLQPCGKDEVVPSPLPGVPLGTDKATAGCCMGPPQLGGPCHLCGREIRTG